MRYIAILAILIWSVDLNAQEKVGAILSIENNSYNFGRIREDQGNLSHTFTFSNNGTQPLVVSNVRSTCGCAVPEWSKEPILPGEKGSITVEFSPSNRVGQFHKTIQIQSTAINTNMFLTITGTVLPPLKEEKLGYKIGNLDVKSKHINFGYIFKGNTAQQTITIANPSDKKIELQIEDVPEHLKVSINPATIDPGEFGQIEVQYNSNLINDWDVIIDRLAVKINGSRVDKDKFAVTANLREDFSQLTKEQLLNAPVASFEVKSHVFDTITDDKVVKCSFILKNDGNSDLIIRALKPSCGCTIAKQKKNVLSPGASTKIVASFDPKGRSGEFKNAITVITNDPNSYKQYLSAEGYIKR